jgi:hypothetical protein
MAPGSVTAVLVLASFVACMLIWLEIDGGAIAGIGTEKLVAFGFSVARAVRLGAGSGGGALVEASFDVGGRFASGGGGGGSLGVSVETVVSPVDWKSGGSTYRLKSTFPPKSTTMSRWIISETVRNRDARIGRRNRSKLDWGAWGIESG